MNTPFVSVIIPCRNEEFFISNCLDSLLANDYPKDKTEFLAIDGLSIDNTLTILAEYAGKYPQIKILKNQKKIFPAAVNTGIRESKGELIFIIGAHATYGSDYISKCVEISIRYNADNVGGAIETVPVKPDLTGKLISFVLSNPFGVGDSKFRTGSKDIIETDTVFGGCYKRGVFQKYGLLNENLVSTSDYEFNKRIKRGGARIFLIPDIRIIYFTRSTIFQFVKNNLRNGFWAIYPISQTSSIPVSLRHFIPMVFVLSLSLLIVLSFRWNFSIYILISLIIFYLLCSVFFSVKTIENKYHLLPFLPFLFLILHLTYGIGSLGGLISVFSFKIKNLLKK